MSTIINEISFNVIRSKVQLKLFLFFMNREHTIEYLHARTFKRITPQINLITLHPIVVRTFLPSTFSKQWRTLTIVIGRNP